MIARWSPLVGLAAILFGAGLTLTGVTWLDHRPVFDVRYLLVGPLVAWFGWSQARRLRAAALAWLMAHPLVRGIRRWAMRLLGLLVFSVGLVMAASGPGDSNPAETISGVFLVGLVALVVWDRRKRDGTT
jgi:hypothetical protein